MKILITGANGFVGKALTSFLQPFNFEIIQLGNSKEINLSDFNQVMKIPKVDIIIHLAAKTFVPDSFKNPRDYYSNNINSTINILEKARLDHSKIIFFSTYVYGKPKYLPIDENHDKNPINPYTESKVLCENLCKSYHRDFNLPVTIFRPFNIYGPNQDQRFFIPSIIKQLENKVINLSDPRPKRDFIFISDLVEAVYLDIIHASNSFNIYNLGSGKSIYIKDVVSEIINQTKSKATVKFSNLKRKGEILDTVADISKIKNNLGWEPKINLYQGLKIILNKII